MQSKGQLYLIPSSISDNHEWFYPNLKRIINSIDRFLAETPKTARKFIKTVDTAIHLESLEILTYNKETKLSEIETLLSPLKQGKNIGIITDAGMPGIADPGNKAILKAHEWRIKVKPLVGPSSIILGLSASGLNGQQFAFHGYLPIQGDELRHLLRKLEIKSGKDKETQIFIETPYRNAKLFTLLLKELKPETYLSIGFDLTGSQEQIITKPIRQWKKEPFSFSKLPCIFMFLAQ